MDLGIVTVCMGFTQTFAGLVVCRIFLGMCEAGFFPGKVPYNKCLVSSNQCQAACT